MESGVKRNFEGLLENIRRPPNYPEMLRLYVEVKILLAVPFLQDDDFIFVLYTLANIAAIASLIRSYGTDQ